MSLQPKRFYEFGPFCVDASDRLLLRQGDVVPLSLKSFDLLLILVESRGRVLLKNELMSRVWPDSFVEEANLSHHVFTLRKALGDAKNGNKYIETIPRRGYRFVADVALTGDRSEDSFVTERSASHIVIEESQHTSTAFIPADAAQTNKAGPDKRDRSIKVPLLAGAVAVIAVGLASYLWLARKTQTNQPPNIRSIAVLPFKPLVGDDRNEALELGMADALITKLSAVTQIIVRPVSAIRRYNGLEQDALAAGRELGVDYVVEGNLQMVGEQTRATVRLLKVNDGRAIWTDKCDQQCSSIFELQDSVAQQITGALAVRITSDQKMQLAKHYTENVEAYQLYLKGLFFWNKFTDEAIAKSINYFQQAIDKDPTYALAYTGISKSHNVLGTNGPISAKDALPKVKYAAEKAVQLDDNLAQAHHALGAFKLFYEWDWPGAERAFKRAIELDPSYADPHGLYGYLLRTMGRFDEALAEIRIAQRLDPASLLVSSDYGETLRLARRYDQAIEEMNKTLEMDPNFADVHLNLGNAYGLKGMYDQAVTEMKTAIRLSGNNTQIVARLGYVYALAGNRTEAHKIIDQLQAALRKQYFSPLEIAMIYATLGENDNAFAWLEKALDDHSAWLIELKIEPGWDRIRTDPRFSSLLSRVGLPD